MGQKKRHDTRAMRLRGSCAALGLAAGLALLAAPGPARAADDGNSDSTGFYNATFGRLLEGFGLQKADGNSETRPLPARRVTAGLPGGLAGILGGRLRPPA